MATNCIPGSSHLLFHAQSVIEWTAQKALMLPGQWWWRPAVHTTEGLLHCASMCVLHNVSNLQHTLKIVHYGLGEHAMVYTEINVNVSISV